MDRCSGRKDIHGASQRLNGYPFVAYPDAEKHPGFCLCFSCRSCIIPVAKGGAFLRYLRRFIWFIASRLLVVLLVLGLLTVAFYFSMNATNIYIIVKDGMARRAQVIMMDEPVSQLDNYFSSTWIARDEWLQSALNDVDPYRDCTVTGFDHRISLSRVWCWPWDDTASAVVTERIPAIDGKSASGTVPEWPSGKYNIILTRENGNWKIKDITLIEWINDE
jgi:hypothetical protein